MTPPNPPAFDPLKVPESNATSYPEPYRNRRTVGRNSEAYSAKCLPSEAAEGAGLFRLT